MPVAGLVTVEFEMANGSLLECKYSYNINCGSYECAPDGDYDVPHFFIDGEEIELDEMPKGLNAVAVEMYNNPNKFNFTVDGDCQHG